MVNDCMKQFPSLVDGTAKPDFDNFIVIQTTDSLTGISCVLSQPINCLRVFGKLASKGLFFGAHVEGV